MVNGKKRKPLDWPLILFLALAQLLQLLEAAGGGERLHPLVLVPGSVGSQLEARLTEGYRPSSLLCGRWARTRRDKEGWFRLWFDPALLRMTLLYSSELDDYRNAPGVETRVPHFGSTLGLLYRDPHLKHITEYMATLVRSLEEIGYRDGENLFGAPYDFRYGLAAEGHPSKVGAEYLRDLKGLVENATASNGGRPVILVSHSLGGLFVLQLLNRNPPSWRQRFVKHFVALSAPWGGAVRGMLTFASGYSVGIPGLDPLLVRDEQRSSESNLWLLPSPKVFGSSPLVITPERNFSATEVPEFLEEIGFPEGVLPYKTRILPLVERLPVPKVPVTNIIGTGVKTPERLVYGKEGFDRQPEVVYGDGDGTVNLASLLALASGWGRATGQWLKVVNISHVCHRSILKDEAAVRVIMQEICEINSHLMGSSATETSIPHVHCSAPDLIATRGLLDSYHRVDDH
ncbi:unnamed protein product [Spirodela intermedia]|uniref:Uncharacterized protein n=1 Tax=Spirodela intermedia TaxID=51605 RepID=A0A7I8IIZ4_SPIIN|nr:unnamed protein product [Spirodela intermedia]CAA6657697.1 unnamed protein product [Spirodela intermedia]